MFSDSRFPFTSNVPSDIICPLLLVFPPTLTLPLEYILLLFSRFPVISTFPACVPVPLSTVFPASILRFPSVYVEVSCVNSFPFTSILSVPCILLVVTDPSAFILSTFWLIKSPFTPISDPTATRYIFCP